MLKRTFGEKGELPSECLHQFEVLPSCDAGSKLTTALDALHYIGLISSLILQVKLRLVYNQSSTEF